MEYVVGLLAGWLTLALGQVSYARLRRWWRRRRYGHPFDHSALLVGYGHRLSGAPDQQALGRLLAVDLPQTVQVERAALLLPEVHQLVDVNAPDFRLPVSHAAVRWVASAGEAQRANRGRLHDLIGQGRPDLTWTRAWVPLMRGTELKGMWLLGERSQGAQYAPEDLDCLTAIARQAAVMLEAARYAEQGRQSAAEIRALYQQVVVTREEERGRLARELHDGVLQDLCAVTRDLKALEAQTAHGTQAALKARAALGAQGALIPRAGQEMPARDGGVPFPDLAERAGETVRALRAICNDLRPPLLQSDLGTALKALVEELDRRSTAAIHIEISAQDLHIADDVALAVFRITQESLNNAIRHADASEIAVRLTQYPDRLRLTVTDDGRGIAGGVDPARFVAQGHLGVAGMRERAAMIGGRLDVQTALDYGTVVILELPS